jgi:hypothetical protein
MKLLSSWWQFTKERFDPGSHLLMIAFFVAVHQMAAGVLLWAPLSGARVLATGLVAVLFFFKLRLYDEIKDYEVDLEFNPTRPLARGLLTVTQVKRAIALVLAVELIILAFLGMGALVVGTVAITYSLLMFREFFIGSLIRPHLTTYAVTHTFVSSLLSATLLTALSGTSPLEWTRGSWAFVLASWFLFNIFEFGRKTFASHEERGRVESYSKIFGRSGAVTLVMIQAGIASWLYVLAFPKYLNVMGLALAGTALFLTGMLYSLKDDGKWAKVYRSLSSGYIVLVFSVALAASFFNW